MRVKWTIPIVSSKPANIGASGINQGLPHANASSIIQTPATNPNITQINKGEPMKSLPPQVALPHYRQWIATARMTSPKSDLTVDDNMIQFFTQADEDNFTTALQGILFAEKNSPLAQVKDKLIQILNSAESNPTRIQLLQTPFFVALKRTLNEPLFPMPDNFTPASRTPWGGIKIPEMMRSLGVTEQGIVGEAWVQSGHDAFPSVYAFQWHESRLAIPAWFVGRAFPAEFYGQNSVIKFGSEAPILTKLLNSGSWQEYRQELKDLFSRVKSKGIDIDFSQLDGKKNNNHQLHVFLTALSAVLHDISEATEELEKLKAIHQNMLQRNLSVQIHPNEEYAQKMNDSRFLNPHSKNEAWVILDAEDGAGIYLGLAEGVTEEKMRLALQNNEDISSLLNFVPVKKGDVFNIPAGTPHAIGSGITLLEPQETSETTFRYYDWGRPRELHVNHALAVTNWQMTRGWRGVAQLTKNASPLYARGEEVTFLIEEQQFVVDRIALDPRVSYSIRSLRIPTQVAVVVTEGAEISVIDAKNNVLGMLGQGQTLTIPALRDNIILKNESLQKTVFYLVYYSPPE